MEELILQRELFVQKCQQIKQVSEGRRDKEKTKGEKDKEG